MLNRQCRIVVKEAEEKVMPQPGMAYIAPADYHLMVEADRTLSLSREERVNFSRPSIDVLFETAAEAYADKLIGVVLTGANADGSQGLQLIKKLGGTCVVQDPLTAVSARMPQSAIASTEVDYVVPLGEIAPLILGLLEGKNG
jgi:two-component system chemotaxis response regulator CheB